MTRLKAMSILVTIFADYFRSLTFYFFDYFFIYQTLFEFMNGSQYRSIRLFKIKVFYFFN